MKLICLALLATGTTCACTTAAAQDTTRNIKLKTVDITSRKPFVEQKTDRTIIHPDVIITAGTTVMDVLEKAPGVRVDIQGGITLKGLQGVMVYMDGRQLHLSGNDLDNYLRSIPSSTLDQIEIMTNPPASYDAAGGAGIINLKIKKNKIKGFNAGLNLNARLARYSAQNYSADIYLRKNKVNLFGNFFYGERNSFNDIHISRRYKDSLDNITGTFDQRSFIHRKGYGFRTMIGADYYPTEKTTIGIVLNGLVRYPEITNESTGRYNTDPVHAINHEKGSFKNGTINTNYRRQYNSSDHELTANLDYLIYQVTNNQTFNVLTTKELLTGNLPAEIQIYSARTDYNRPLQNKWKLGVGLKTSYTKTDNIAAYFNPLPDYSKTNHFQYKEQISAAYMNINKDFAKLSIQAGLRLENTLSDGHQLGNLMKADSTFNRQYTSLFPTIFLLYKVDTNSVHQVKFNYGRRINRPYYQDLNPFITPMDQYTYYTGNPYLLPAFSDKLEAGYIFKNMLTATVSYSHTKHLATETIEIADGNYYSRPGNIGSSQQAAFSLDATIRKDKWFLCQLNGAVTFVHAQSDFYTGRLDVRNTYFGGQFLCQFVLPKQWTIQVDGNYQSSSKNTQFVMRSRGKVNMGVSKKLSKIAMVRLSVSDIFYTDINAGDINNLYRADASFRTLSDTRATQLTLSFRLGKTVAGQRKHDNNGTDTEQSRIKN